MMKTVKKIRERQLSLVRVLADCSRDCANKAPAFWCGVCSTSKTTEEALAWVTGEKSIFQEHIEQMRELKNDTG